MGRGMAAVEYCEVGGSFYRAGEAGRWRIDGRSTGGHQWRPFRLEGETEGRGNGGAEEVEGWRRRYGERRGRGRRAGGRR
jgi:hypothetical protein